MAGGVGLWVLLSLAPAALAETFTVPNPVAGGTLLGIGTNGDDSAAAGYSVSQGGCTGHSGTAVAAGENNRQCGGGVRNEREEHSEARGDFVAIGLMEADAWSHIIAVSPDGDAYTECTGGLLTSCDAPTAAISGTGSAWSAGFLAVSGTGPASGVMAVSGTGPAANGYWSVSGANSADSGYLAVSGAGPATAPHAVSGGSNASGGAIGVAGVGNATGQSAAVAILGSATTRPCTGDAVQDALGGYAISVFGNAYGCNRVSVTGEAGERAP